MRVQATAKAFFAGKRVRPGDVIVVPDGFSASWAKPVELPKAKESPPAKKKAKRKAAQKKTK